MRLIDADEMAIVESAAYMNVNTREDISEVDRALNSVVHWKIQQLIADTPTVDAVPVVRCGDCKYGKGPEEDSVLYCTVWGSFSVAEADGFCCYGERWADNG